MGLYLTHITHGELGNAGLRGRPALGDANETPATREPEPDNAGGGIAYPCTHSLRRPPTEAFVLRAVLFANGDLNDLEAARALLRPDDLLLAADGGGRHCLALGVSPAAVVGDMDSLTEEELRALERGGAEISRHPPRKDETDLELALLLAKERGAVEVLVLGGLGNRWDMSLANLLLAAYPPLTGLHITFWQDGQRLFLIRDEIRIEGGAGDTVSLIPVGGDAVGVTTEGLEYPLKSETLVFGGTRGVSNRMTGVQAQVRLEVGLLLCVVGNGR